VHVGKNGSVPKPLHEYTAAAWDDRFSRRLGRVGAPYDQPERLGTAVLSLFGSLKPIGDVMVETKLRFRLRKKLRNGDGTFARDQVRQSRSAWKS
jgi:hypothetical protein